MENIQRNLVMLEINLLLAISIILHNEIIESIFIIFEFMAIRTLFGAKHYDKPLECFVMTMILMTSIFLVLKINFGLAMIATAFASINLSNVKINKVGVNFLAEGFMYKKKGETKYDQMDVWIKNNLNSEKLEQYEQKLRNYRDEKVYEIYMIRFCERTENGEIPSLSVIESRTKVTKRRIVEYLDRILFSFEMFCMEEKDSIKK